MRVSALVMTIAVVAAALPVAASAQKEESMQPSEYIVMPHMKGSLALQVSSITSVWFMPATEGRPVSLRVLSQALSEAKTCTGSDAESLWASLSKQDGLFLLVSHMGGTLAIPRAQIRTAYYSEDSGAPRLRLAYDGDPSGKTLDGAEATVAWTALRR